MPSTSLNMPKRFRVPWSRVFEFLTGKFMPAIVGEQKKYISIEKTRGCVLQICGIIYLVPLLFVFVYCINFSVSIVLIFCNIIIFVV